MLLAIVSGYINWYLKPWLKRKNRYIIIAVIWIFCLLFILDLDRTNSDERRLLFSFPILLFYFVLGGIVVILLYAFFKHFFNHARLNTIFRVISPIIIAFTYAIGVYQAYTPVIRHNSITLPELSDSLRIALVSDIHLKKIFGNQAIDRLVTLVNQQQVDMVILAGDLLDKKGEDYRKQNMQENLSRLNAKLGVYAVLGNHDIINNAADIVEDELKLAGIQVLRDEFVVIDNRFVLIGRNDQNDATRLELDKLLKLANHDLPSIVLDHQPTWIVQNSLLDFDIQLSGHTHGGQMFPSNLLSKYSYPLSHGYQEINGRHFFVTSGYGFSGLPFRFGVPSEIMIIDINR